ncbi:MAG: hypothetical protein LBI14_00370 [Treponema sp.]|nr:hypothetical protein [Treponema sp.]
MAYYFHWQRGDILGLTMQERKIWLSQINRIHAGQKRVRGLEMVEQVEYLMNLRNSEGGT